MIIEYDTKGQITHVVYDPVPPGLAQVMTDAGATFIDKPPVQLPPEPLFDLDGEPIMETIQDVPVLDENGEPLVNEVGEPIVENKQVQMIDSPGIVLFEVNLDTDYVLDGEVVSRPVFPWTRDEIEIAADGLAEAYFADIPEGCTVTIDGQGIEVTDGELTIDSEMPAEYVIRFECWPHIPKTVKVIAHAPISE